MKKYRLILADPPWGAANFGPKISAHYPLMFTDNICKMPIQQVSHEDCVLILWSTWTHIEDALRVMKSWGFTYVAGFPWIKLKDPPIMDLFGEFRARPTWGLGAWCRGCSEPILIGKKGAASPPLHAHFLGLLSKRLQHSRKPENIYEYAQSFPGPYLELFARRKVDGWDSWGNEIESDISLSLSVPNKPLKAEKKDVSV